MSIIEMNSVGLGMGLLVGFFVVLGFVHYAYYGHKKISYVIFVSSFLLFLACLYIIDRNAIEMAQSADTISCEAVKDSCCVSAVEKKDM